MVPVPKKLGRTAEDALQGNRKNKKTLPIVSIVVPFWGYRMGSLT